MKATPETISTGLVPSEKATMIREAFEKMLESELGCLMVVARERLVGIVTERDVLRGAASLLGDRAG